MPGSILFQRHLDDDEIVSMVVHKHWLVGCKVLLWPTLLLILDIVLLALQPTRPLLIVLLTLDIVFAVWWLRNFFDYYLDAWIVTDQGIIDIAWHGWFHRQSTRVLYSDLQGVSYEIKGVWGTLLRFGTLEVEKISTGSTIELEYVSQPRKVESLILQNMEAYLHKKNLKDGSQIQGLLADLLSQQLMAKEFNTHDAASAEDEDDGDE